MINLLNQEDKEIRRINQRFRLLLVFFATTTVLAISTWLSVLYVEQILAAKNSDLDSQSAEITAKIIKFRDMEKEVTDTNNRLSQITEIKSTTIQWSTILANLANQTPSTIQINNLVITPSAASKDKNKSSGFDFTISGTAKTLDDIEIFRKTLDEGGVFSNSIFKSANFNKDLGTFTFSLTTNLIPK